MPSTTITDMSKKAARAILESEKLLLLIGHGINIDAGIPEIRTKHEMWKYFPAFDQMKYYRAQIMSYDLFEGNPSQFWYYYGSEYNTYKQMRPNPVYEKLLRLCHVLKRNNYFAMTTNYDDYLLKTGFPEHTVFQAHGSLYTMTCTNLESCGYTHKAPIEPKLDHDEGVCMTIPTCIK